MDETLDALIDEHVWLEKTAVWIRAECPYLAEDHWVFDRLRQNESEIFDRLAREELGLLELPPGAQLRPIEASHLAGTRWAGSYPGEPYAEGTLGQAVAIQIQSDRQCDTAVRSGSVRAL